MRDGNHPDYASGDVPVEELGHAELSNSRWFTRGWTLQELIAPAKLVFFDATWNQLGTKDNLLRSLWQITKIDPPALATRAVLSEYVIARKMAWAAGRETTRIEDRAYSLFGLFGVNMPLLYEEGEQAFIRFQEEIVRRSTDHSIFAWSTLDPLPENSNDVDLLFARSPRHFSNCRKMVRWTSNLFDEEFHVTNRGITFGGLLCVETKEDFFAVLNCRYEDDFSGVLALRLCNTGESVVLQDADIKKDPWEK